MSEAPAERVEAAFEYAYPLFALAQTRHRAVHDPLNPARFSPNSVQHLRELSDHTSRWITAPNNDTLYSNAWLDLSGGPVRIQVGAQPAGRYWSVALLDAWTNHIAVLGEPLEGQGPVDVMLMGPGHAATGDTGRVIRAPGQDVWLFARWLVDGPDDLANAQAMQDRLAVCPPAGFSSAAPVVPGSATDPRNFLAVVNEALARNPPPEAQQGLVADLADLGLRKGVVDAWNDLPEAARLAWTSQIGTALERVRQFGTRGRRDVQGWIASAADIGNFGNHFALRASVALGGLGALEPSEAMYFVRYQDDTLQPLDGQHRYLLRVPSGGIPTDAFWSFSMYEATADGKRVFVDNPIRRYSIGNRTAGLAHQPDGSLDIVLQRERPETADEQANWLPAPAGRFQIALRAYRPRPPLLKCVAPMPRVVRGGIRR